MNKRIIVAGVAATLLCSGAYLLAHQQVKQPDVSTQVTTQKESALRTKKDYEAIASSVKADKEPVVVGKVFENGYLKKHGNHYHFVKGTPPKDAIYENVDTADLGDDGYQFDPKDIVEENELGYVVRHGNHFHFIPKKNLNLITRPNNTTRVGNGVTPLPSIPSKPQSLASQLEKRIAEIMQRYGIRRDQIIVNEQEGTIIYPHGNHYHYEKIGEPHQEHDDHGHHDEHDHHDHEHADKPKADENAPKADDKDNSEKDNQSSQTEKPENGGSKDGTEKPHDKDSQLNRKAAIEKRVAEIMQRYGLRRDQIIVNEQEGTIVYPHGNHYHYEKIGNTHHDDHEENHEHHDNDHHDNTKPDNGTSKDGETKDDTPKENEKPDNTPKDDNQGNVEKPKDNTEKEITPEVKALVEKRVAEIMQKYGLTRDKIKVDIENNAIIYPHGSHYHYEKIDPNKPLTNHNRHGLKEEKDDGLAHTETHKIVGPLAVTREQLLNKEAIAKAYPNLPVKNMSHYHIVGFLAYPNSRVKVGDLKQDGKLTDGVVYLVLKNTPWKEVSETIKTPEVQPKEGYYFKQWTYPLPTEDVVDGDRIFGAQFRLEKFKNSPVVLGPSATRDIPGSENVDLHDYVPIAFHTLPNGHFIVNGQQVKHVFYLVKQGTTWREAFANGFKLPETSPDASFEFAGFSQDLTKDLDKKVSSEFIWAKFEANVPVLGVYRPTDENNPLSESDPKRPQPKDSSLPYDPEKYVTIAFRAGENGYLSTFFEEGKLLTYIVRKGTTWKELQGELPSVIANQGYRIKDNLPQGDEKIESSRVYEVTFEKDGTDNSVTPPFDNNDTKEHATLTPENDLTSSGTQEEIAQNGEIITEEEKSTPGDKMIAEEEAEMPHSTESTTEKEVETAQSVEQATEKNVETAQGAN